MYVHTYVWLLHQLREPKRKDTPGNFLVVQWLGPQAFYCQGLRFNLGWKTKIWQAVGVAKKKRKIKKRYSKSNLKCLREQYGVSQNP